MRQKILKLPHRLLSWFKAKSVKKKIAIVIGVIVLLLIISTSIQNALKPPPYTLAKVQKRSITEVVSESGNIAMTNTTPLYSPGTGIVEEIYVANGDAVTEGQELFTVKSTATEQEKSAAYATYLTAKATLQAAQSNANVLRADMYGKWKTYTDIATNDTYETGEGKPKTQERESAEFQIAQDGWKAAEAKYNDQQTAIAQGQAQLNSTYLLYQATQNAIVKAPVDGTIKNLSLSRGSTVTAKSATSSTPPALTIATASTIEAVIALTEADALKVKPGQDVEIDVTAINNKTFKGNVVRVDDIGTSIQGVIVYYAYIQIYSTDSQLKAGMTIDADIITKKTEDVLAVPNASVKPYQGGRAVRVVSNKTKQIEFLPVVIGTKGEDYTQIVKGLSEGQEIVTSLSNDQIKRPGLF